MRKPESRFSARVIIIAAGFLITGCLSFSTKPGGLEPSAYDTRYRGYEVLGEGSGESSSFNLLWLIPVTPEISYKEAVDEAIAGKQGDNLIEVQIYREKQWWIIGRIDVLTVKGKVIRYTD